MFKMICFILGCIIGWGIGHIAFQDKKETVPQNNPVQCYIFTGNWEPTAKEILTDRGVDDTESCLRWAFGEDYNSLELRELDDRWRERHSDLFIIEGHDDIAKSLRWIAGVWLWAGMPKD